MSTSLTQDTHFLTIARSSADLYSQIMDIVCRELHTAGYQTITPSALLLLSQLDCGEATASELARNLGVSRQRITNSVKELKQEGYLQQAPARGKRIPLSLSQDGQAIIAKARQVFAQLDKAVPDSKSGLNLSEYITMSAKLLSILSELKADNKK